MYAQRTGTGSVREVADSPVGVTIRPARLADAGVVARILAEAFPSLYLITFGHMDESAIAALLERLYHAGSLSLETTRVAVRGDEVIGLAILHVGRSIGRGSLSAYWRAVGLERRGWQKLRAFCGGLLMNYALDERIPRAADLVYIEALAVSACERGQGIGTHLLADVADWTRAAGRTRLALHVLATNQGARRLYERSGFHASRTTFRPLARVERGPLLLYRSLRDEPSPE